MTGGGEDRKSEKASRVLRADVCSCVQSKKERKKKRVDEREEDD